MPRLSIIIPCLGGAAEFDGTLVSVLQNRPADCEVIVAHTEHYNDPYALSGEVHFLHAQAASIVELLNAALDETTGDVVHIIGCGLEAREGWTTPAMQHFDDPDVACVSPIMNDSNGTLVAAGVRCSLTGARRVVADARIVSRGGGRLRATILGPLLTAAFYRREILVALGGFEAALGDELADVGVALAMQSLGRMHVAEPASQLVLVNEPLQAHQQRFATGRARQRVFFRRAAATNATASLPLHVLAISGEALQEVATKLIPWTLFGRLAAWIEVGALAAYSQRLVQAGDRLQELAELRASVRKSSRRAAAHREPAPIERRRAA